LAHSSLRRVVSTNSELDLRRRTRIEILLIGLLIGLVVLLEFTHERVLSDLRIDWRIGKKSPEKKKKKEKEENKRNRRKERKQEMEKREGDERRKHDKKGKMKNQKEKKKKRKKKTGEKGDGKNTGRDENKTIIKGIERNWSELKGKWTLYGVSPTTRYLAWEMTILPNRSS
jgi:hypothetical protein